jgi:peptidoglycan/xylan/chitin deacetylase (PgdA/CDA1 family)
MKGLIRAIQRFLRPYSPRPDIHQRVFRRQTFMASPVPVASFTFDDFPHSAWVNGGRILERFGAHGTYYTSLGLMGREDYYGPLFTKEDLNALVAKGHEVACHTYSHVGARQTRLETFEHEILKNRRRAEELLPGYILRNFSYPGGEVTLRLKRRMRRHAISSRGTYVGVNRRWVDLDLLLVQNLFENTPLDGVKNILDACQANPGWLIFYGHEVCESPARYGCTPEYLEAVLEIVGKTCRILTVKDALALFQKNHAQ